MTVYPPSAPNALGFDAILRALHGLASSDVGRKVLEGEEPIPDQGGQARVLALVSEFQALLKFDDPFNLTGLDETRSVLARVGPEGSFLEGEELRRILGSLTCARVACSYLNTRAHKYPLLSAFVSDVNQLPDLERLLDQRIDERGSVRDNASPRLRELNRARIRAESTLHRALQVELKRASESGFAADGQPTVRGGRLVLPIRAEAKRKVQGFVHDVSSTGQTVFIEPASCLDANNDLVSIDADIRREIVAILVDTTAAVVAEKSSINHNTDRLAALDALAAKARLANKLDASVPSVAEGFEIELIDARNPELVLATASDASARDAIREVIPLNLRIGVDAHTLIVTGPNAGGKTVALKTIGLFALMLSRGIPVPADERTRFPFVQNLLVDIGDEQSVENDLSTYSAHMVRIAGMMRQAGAGSVVLIDEAGTGTDPVEGGAIAQAVLEHLGRSGALTIVTTHHNALKAFAHDSEGIVNGSMVFDLESLSPTFRFRMGVPGSSYGLEIAKRSGLADDVLARARELVGDDARSVEDLLATLEMRLEHVREQQEVLERTANEAEQSRAKNEERAAYLREEKSRILTAAQVEASRILKGANKRVENTIREIRESQADKAKTRKVRAELDEVRATVDEKVSAAVEKARRKEAKAKKGTSADSPAQKIIVGDKVVVDGGSTAVEVLSITGKQAELAFNSGRMKVDLKRLAKVGGKSKQSVQVSRIREQNKRGEIVSGLLNRRIDLRGTRVEDALAQVTRLVDEAIAAGLDSVEILHGKGTGALRQAIRQNLLDRGDVRTVDDAEIEAGGSGITVVTL